MKNILLILLVAMSWTAAAQKFSIKGQLRDTLDNPLPSATVLLLNPKDSSLVNFGVGDAQGNFEIRNVSRGEHVFKVTFMGFRAYTQKINAPETGNVIELGTIRMEPASNELDAIEIAADRAPVTVKRDTIEFNAGSFRTKQNAVVEDLLKKLPGVEVDNDGNITSQGEQVRNVTVDGKNFFGRDPKLATRNLPADAIDKVQVFDKKSDQSAFSGIDDGQREKTINLELKPEKRNGTFGTLMAGGGTDDRFQSRVNLNKFSKGRQLSFLGMANNVNEQGFSMDDYMNFTGGSAQMMGGGAMRLQINGDNTGGVPLNFGNRANGIMTNYAGGLNFNNEFTKKTEMNGSYFYNYLDHDKDQTTFRQNFLPDSRSFTFNQNSRQRNSNSNHRVNLVADHRLDSANSLKLTTSATYNDTDSEVVSTSENRTPDDQLQSQGERLSLSAGTTASLNTALLWRHKFARKGRTFSTNLLFNAGETERTGYLDATNNFYGTDPSVVTSRQSSDQSSLYRSYGATLSYTEPLGGRKYLEANYSYRRNLNEVDRDVFDVGGEDAVYLDSLSNRYTSDYQYHRTGLNFRMNKSKYNLVVGGSLQQTHLQGDLEIQDVTIERSYENVLPAVRFNYDFSSTRHLRFDYETSVEEPTVQQLQPVVDNSDPLNLYVGNPGLRPAYSQSWRLNFTTFDPATFLSFFAFVDVDYTTNAITNAQYIDEDFVRTTMPVNVNDNMDMRGNASVSVPLSKLKSRLSIGGNYRNQRSINLLNEVANTIRQQTAGGTLRYNFTYKEFVDISLSANKDYQLTAYEFNQDDQNFVNSTYTAEGNFSFLQHYQLAANFEYLEYENQSTGYRQNIPLLNLSVSRFILKNKSGELKLGVNNLLDKALGVNQTASVNYLERQTTNSLGRYFMVSFTYSLNKQLNPMGVRRGGGRMMRIMR